MKNNDERRTGMEQMKSDIANMTVDIALIKNMIDANHRSLRTGIEKIETLVARHDSTLYGNGTPGLTSLRGDFKSHTQRMNRHEAFDMWLQGLLLTATLALVGWTWAFNHQF